MGQIGTPHFTNDIGAEKIEVGVREFKCIGAKSPFDHPHVFLDMGQDNDILCPYCSTCYVYNPALEPTETKPANCLVSEEKESA